MCLVGFCEVMEEEDFFLVVIIDEFKVIKKVLFVFMTGLDVVKRMKIGIWVV